MNNFGQFFLTIFLSLFLSIAALVIAPHLLARDAIKRYVAHWHRALELGWGNRIFVAQFFGFIFVFTLLATLRYTTFHTGYLGINTSWDLAQYDQIIWTSLHGHLFENSFILDARTFLGKSFTPILISFVPLYSVWTSPIVLLVVQTLAVGFSTFPIYWFSRAQVGSWLALALSAAFLLSPGLENIVLTEFHEIALATPLLALATFFLLKRHYLGLLVSLAVALLIKEEIAFVVVAFGLYLFLVQRKRWFGLALAVFGSLWGAALLQYIIPFFRGAEHGDTFYYFGQGLIGSGGARYSYLGQSIPDIAITLITRPDVVLSHVLIPDKIEYVFNLFAPLVFVPLLGAEVSALALPTFGYSLLSTYALQYSIRSYYFAPLLPFLFFGATIGLQRTIHWVSTATWLARQEQAVTRVAIKGALSVLILTASGATYFFQSPGPFGGDFQIERYKLNERAILGNQLVAMIPNDATVVVQNEYLAHLSNRRQIYEIPIPDYRQVEYFFADRRMKWFDVHRGHWDHYLRSGYFQVLADQDGYLIGKRVSPEKSLFIRFRDEITLVGYSTVPTGTLKGGMTLRPIVLWRAEKPVQGKYTIAIRVSDAQGHVWAEEDREPQDGSLPTDRWEIGKIVGDQYSIRLPPTMPAGEYQITVGVHQGNGDPFEARDVDGNSLGIEPIVAPIRIEKNKASFVASDLVKEQPLVAYFVDMREIRFLGYYPMRETIHRDEPIQLGLYWRARQKPRGDYIVAVQLRDATGRVAFEDASRPAKDTYPTTLWDEGEVLLDWHDFQVPLSFDAGAYQIYVVLRDATTQQQQGEVKIMNLSVTR